MVDWVRRTLLISAATLCLAAPVAAQQDSLEQQFDRALPAQGQAPAASQPVVQPLAAQQPRLPAVQPWPVADAQAPVALRHGKLGHAVGIPDNGSIAHQLIPFKGAQHGYLT